MIDFLNTYFQFNSRLRKKKKTKCDDSQYGNGMFQMRKYIVV